MFAVEWLLIHRVCLLRKMLVFKQTYVALDTFCPLLVCHDLLKFLKEIDQRSFIYLIY